MAENQTTALRALAEASGHTDRDAALILQNLAAVGFALVPAKPEMVHQTTIRDEAAELAERILEYFDSYRLGSVAPIAAEIEAALNAAYARGKADG